MPRPARPTQCPTTAGHYSIPEDFVNYLYPDRPSISFHDMWLEATFNSALTVYIHTTYFTFVSSYYYACTPGPHMLIFFVMLCFGLDERSEQASRVKMHHGGQDGRDGVRR